MQVGGGLEGSNRPPKLADWLRPAWLSTSSQQYFERLAPPLGARAGGPGVHSLKYCWGETEPASMYNDLSDFRPFLISEVRLYSAVQTLPWVLFIRLLFFNYFLWAHSFSMIPHSL